MRPISVNPLIFGSNTKNKNFSNPNISSNMYIRDWRTALKAPPTYKIGNRTFRVHFHAAFIVLSAATLALIFVFVSNASRSSSDAQLYKESLLTYRRYNTTYPITVPVFANGIYTYRIGLIADLDTNSKTDKNPPSWRSYFMKGHLTYKPATAAVNISWDDGHPTELESYYSLKGRGMELSELTTFDGRLLTFDDRTGLIYNIKQDKMIPWIILMDGDGSSVKGFKSEWATVKNKMLYVGSMGKEWTTSGGEYENDNPMYIKAISPNGEIHHINWSNNYKAIREVLGIQWPGYMIHESGMWSDEQQRWFFLPRRCSRDRYNETRDELMGCNFLISATDDFKQITAVKIGTKINPAHGYSSFKFIPGTNDNVIISLSTEEVSGKTATYVSVFSLDGKILMEEKKIPTTLKYEGIEFI